MMTPHENLMKSSKEDEEVEDKCLKDIRHLMDENHVSLPYQTYICDENLKELAKTMMTLMKL